MTATDISELLTQQKRAFIKEGAVTAATRIDRLQRLHDLVGRHRRQITEVVSADFGNRSLHQSQMSEVLASMDGIKHAIKNVKRWMRPERRKPPFPFGLLGAKAHIEYAPKGSVGNLSTWNFPVYTALSPLTGILAAGNRAMLKLSELTPETAQLLKTLIEEQFSPEEVAVVLGDAAVGAQFAAQPFDHLIFTGGTHIGRHILEAASKNLTPCTLELGGKSPVVISRSYDLKKAAERIFAGKALNQGQACLAPDYVFVPKTALQDFINAVTQCYSTWFPTLIDNPDVTSVINQRHYQRIRNLIEDARQKGASIHSINPANENLEQQPEHLHKIPLTLVSNVSDDMAIMREEIFGPVMAIKTYDNIDECVTYIAARPRPLGLYYFGNNTNEERFVLDNTISGSVCLNDVMGQASCEDLPFGGIGASGMGHYHGQDGFRTFSHARAIYRQSPINLMKLSGMLPPYSDKCQKQLDQLTKVN